MAATYRDSTIFSADGVTSAPIPKPAGLANDDILVLLVVNRDGNDATQSAPGDFTGIPALTVVQGTANADLRGQVYYKVITDAASEPATFDITFSEAENVMTFGIAISGGDTANPIGSVSASNNASAANVLAASVTTGADDAIVIWAWFNGSGTGTHNADAATTQREADDVSSLTGILATEDRPTAGATGTRTGTFGGSSAKSIGYGITINAAGAAAADRSHSVAIISAPVSPAWRQ
jgi:hypothetical protein